MLLEATQSEQVRAGQAKHSFFKPLPVVQPSKGREEIKKKRKALILFEDIDVVFEEQGEGEKLYFDVPKYYLLWLRKQKEM